MSDEPGNADEPTDREAIVIALAVAGACSLLLLAVLWLVEF